MQTSTVARQNRTEVGLSGPLPVGGAEIESLSNLSLLSEIDDELRRIGASLRSDGEKRSAIRRELSSLRALGTDNPSVRDQIEAREENLASHNSNNEMMMIRLQSLVDQRKNLFLLFSNLLASRNETMMTLVRNLKN